MARMIFLDSGVLIAYANPFDSHHVRVSAFLESHADVPFSVTALSLGEALVQPSQKDQYQQVLESYMDLNLDVEDLRFDDAISLALVRAKSRLKMPDAVILHMAIAHVGSVATTDVALARAAEQKGVTTHLLS